MTGHRMFAAACLIAVGLTAPTVGAAGIDFASMPVGCSWTTRYLDGQVVTETYTGKKAGKHRTTVTRADDPSALVRDMQYDAEGRMVRRNWADGNWETFTPYSCFGEEGTCTYRYRNSSGDDFKIETTTVRNDKGFVVSARPVGGAPYNDDYVELGAFGLVTRNKSKNYENDLISMQNCDMGS